MQEIKLRPALSVVLPFLLLSSCDDSNSLAVAEPAASAKMAVDSSHVAIESRSFEYPLGNVTLTGTLASDQTTDSVDLDLVLAVHNPAKNFVAKYFFKKRTSAQGRERIQLNCEDRPMYALEPHERQRWVDALGAGEIVSKFVLVRIDGAAEESED
jgi:hypothetical protein